MQERRRKLDSYVRRVASLVAWGSLHENCAACVAALEEFLEVSVHVDKSFQYGSMAPLNVLPQDADFGSATTKEVFFSRAVEVIYLKNHMHL